MRKIVRQNIGGVDYFTVGCALTGTCQSAAAEYIKMLTLSDGDEVYDGMSVACTFENGNTAGNAPAAKTIYSSDQVTYYEDAELTVPFTLAPAGCYTVTYTGTGNAYSYVSYPRIQIGDVSGILCTYDGNPIGINAWGAGDTVVMLYASGKFLIMSSTLRIRIGAPAAPTDGDIWLST